MPEQRDRFFADRGFVAAARSCWYDPDREMWKDPVFLASYRVRIRFHTDGTAEEYEVEFTTIRGCYRFDSRRGMMTWENGEHRVVSADALVYDGGHL